MSGRRGALIAAGLLVVVPAIWFWMTSVGPFPGDSIATDVWRRRAFSAEFGSLYRFFADLGSPLVAVPTVAVAAMIIGRRVDPRSGLLVAAAFLTVPIGDLIQVWAGPSPPMREARPANSLDNFPSVHVVYATAVFGTLAIIARRHRRNDATLVLLGLIVLMGPARILEGAHTVSDVLAGYALGGSWLVVAAVLLPKEDAGPGSPSEPLAAATVLESSAGARGRQ